MTSKQYIVLIRVLKIILYFFLIFQTIIFCFDYLVNGVDVKNIHVLMFLALLITLKLKEK